ncbi:hypothetical protein EC968_006407, partial [Mortierella alpina]
KSNNNNHRDKRQKDGVFLYVMQARELRNNEVLGVAGHRSEEDANEDGVRDGGFRVVLDETRRKEKVLKATSKRLRVFLRE